MNILVAIISFVLVRRVLSILPKLVRSGMKLASERALISALVFPHHQLPRHEAGTEHSFRETFERPGRTNRVAVPHGSVGIGSSVNGLPDANRVTLAPARDGPAIWGDRGDFDPAAGTKPPPDPAANTGS